MVSTAAIETQFKQAFRDFLETEKDPALRDLREKAFAAFSLSGFPTQKDEDWKYTSVAQIVSGQWSVGKDPSWPSAAENFGILEKFDYRRNGFTALNMAFGSFAVFHTGREAVASDSVDFDYFSPDVDSMICPHIVIVAEAGSKTTIVESYSAKDKSFTNAAFQIIVEDNASLTHYRVQKDSPEAFNYGVTEVSLGRGSQYNSTNINLGASVSRHDIDVKFTAEGGEAWVDGLYMLNGSQHHDTHSIIDHTVPNCTSHQTYKGVLNDKSRGVFNGKVMVRENAHGTDAQQSNKNLLLSNDARVDTKPQLEIFNDDVKCSHGATVGQLEGEELFYLLTRGLPVDLARNLLTYGFAEQIINKIKIEAIKKELDEAVLNRLGTVLGE